jgi:hypothetical protein
MNKLILILLKSTILVLGKNLTTRILAFIVLLSICINLIIQVSYIQGHEIRIVLYARLDGGDLFFLIVYKEVEFKGFPKLA